MKTPRTDLIVTGNSDPTVDDYEDLATFTRQLERELAGQKPETGSRLYPPLPPLLETIHRRRTDLVQLKRHYGTLI